MAIGLVHWQAHHSHHPGHQRNSLTVSTHVHSSAAGGMRSPSSTQRTPNKKPLLNILLSFYARGFVLVGKNNNNRISIAPYTVVTSEARVSYHHPPDDNG